MFQSRTALLHVLHRFCMGKLSNYLQAGRLRAKEALLRAPEQDTGPSMQHAVLADDGFALGTAFTLRVSWACIEAGCQSFPALAAPILHPGADDLTRPCDAVQAGGLACCLRRDGAPYARLWYGTPHAMAV